MHQAHTNALSCVKRGRTSRWKIIYLLLASPIDQARVKYIPSKIRGLRRDYLLALQANIKARNEYKLLSESLTESSESLNGRTSHLTDQASSANIRDSIELLQAQRKNEKLNILNDYLEKSVQKDAAKPDYATLAAIQNMVGPPPDFQPSAGVRMSEALTKDSNVQELTTRLEKALLRANNSFMRERRLLAEAKAKYRDTVASNAQSKPSPTARTYALSRTRDELIAWIEDRLARINEQDEERPVDQITDSSHSNFNAAQRKANIQKLYNDYLDVQQKIIDFTHQTRHMSKLPKSQARKPNISKLAEKPLLGFKAKALDIVPNVTEHLIPAADAQKAVHQQELHLLNGLCAQNKATIKTLNKLADESHLLASYLMEADPQQLQPSLSGLENPKFSSPPFRGLPGQDDWLGFVEKGRIWAYAAEQARAARNFALEKRLEKGEDHAEAAQISMKELRRLLYGVKEANQSDEQIKTSERNRPNPWSGIDGRIGLERTKKLT